MPYKYNRKQLVLVGIELPSFELPVMQPEIYVLCRLHLACSDDGEISHVWSYITQRIVHQVRKCMWLGLYADGMISALAIYR